MEFTTAQIAEWIEGEIIGDANTSVSGFGKIEEAGEGALTFLANEKYKVYLKDSKASVIIISENLTIPDKDARTFIRVKDAYAAMTRLLDLYKSLTQQKSGIEQPSSIHESAELGEDIYVGAFAYIGKNVKIGDNCKIYPHVFIDDNAVIGDNTVLYSGVKIYDNCVVGKSCIIHSGAIIGSDGFGFQPDQNGVFHKVQQVGNVVIGNQVEIGACCTIDRATMGSTTIEDGVKLDNQIQVAHNVVIGKNTVIAAQAGIAGSTKIGQNNMIGGQVGVAGHIKLGDFVHVQAQSGVNGNIADHSKLYGSPAMDASDFRKSYVYFRKLPELMNKLNQLDKKFNQERKNG
ncbi:UDP-3-O-(3-hydroxymyristoyl)glucosamine N-acyltransferase [Weeksellaceae bacterium KMM 9724]|uniref:UDP-3-O-(3-hydroxymyristoyl)glucosamine N-acyltransferase n=1 Tax=Profundicola chukchiensis TaxID=2961959 RepID=UPI00243A268B|nr:UDP-3-O-(3-hydroxymyristoyl)glucosamine N-acyltransferase [Profundicola chukchiensis]MDG4950318.1 UDP-3-O-(3-hydroxymyristoyl)glucosamine N-acyltransferase [Profundicola chukchiensis]